ncbi:MAG: hypothetical protein F6K36_30620, partial [Symploca sp. SIO3C6]|nr:hypothetical protein [Symploca sp. SIO3C6]
QVAYYREEWQRVEILWTEAIALMEEVAETSAQYSIAQEKVHEYSRNRDYAHSNVVKRPVGAPIEHQLWTKGAPREFLLAVQGLPTHKTQYDSFCRETYYYNDSEVELHHGLVTNYVNHNNNLNASPLLDRSTNRPEREQYWALGSTKQTVLNAQGTPTQVQQYESLGTEIFYYDTSIVELRDEAVVGYSDFDDTLKVNINVMVPQGGYTVVPSIAEVQPSANTWSIGASRADVFRVQGTPNQITRNHTDCLETLHYDQSTVELKNGIVQEYNNLSSNLNVRLTNASRLNN